MIHVCYETAAVKIMAFDGATTAQGSFLSTQQAAPSIKTLTHKDCHKKDPQARFTFTTMIHYDLHCEGAAEQTRYQPNHSHNGIIF